MATRWHIGVEIKALRYGRLVQKELDLLEPYYISELYDELLRIGAELRAEPSV